MPYVRVPLVHLLHSDKQEVVELVHAGFQDCLQPEDLPVPWHHFAADHIPVALERSKKQTDEYVIVPQQPLRFFQSM